MKNNVLRSDQAREIVAPNILEREAPGAGRDAFKWISLAAMFALAFAVSWVLAHRFGSDLRIHGAWAAEGDFLRPRTFLRHGAHPLWHGLVALGMLFGMPMELAAALVTALLKTAQLGLIHRLLTAYLGPRLGRNAISCLALACALVAAVWLPPVNPRVYMGAGSPNTWHSPTQMAALVLMLLCVPYTAYCFQRFKQTQPQLGQSAALPLRSAVTLGALLLLSLLAKPTFMQAFLPAACLYFGWQWLRYPKNSRFFLQVILAVLPAVLFMVVQYLYYFGIIVPSQGNMVLELSWAKLGRGLTAVALIAAFPLYVLCACCPKSRRQDPLVALTLLFFAVGVVEYLVLGEDGRRASDGNFGWGMMGASCMLWVMMLIVFAEGWTQARQRASESDPPGAPGKPSARGMARFGVGFALLAWHLASGLYYLAYLFTSSSPQ